MTEPGFTELNKAHFNSTARTYFNGNEKVFAQVIEEVRSRRGWLGIDFLDEGNRDENGVDADALARNGKTEKRVLKMLDYACGPGTLSRALGSYVTQTLGLDLSDGMVEAYNEIARHEGQSPDEMFAVAGNLLEPKNPSPEEFRDEKWFNFDLIVVGFAFHHFEDPMLAAGRLAERLRPGGVLMIMDFVTHEHPGAGDHSHDHAHGPDHHPGAADHSHGHSHGPDHHPGAADYSHGHSHGPPGHQNHHHAADGSPSALENEGVKAALATVAHAGFANEQMKQTFEKAGVGQDFGFEVMPKRAELTCHGVTVTRVLFMAKGKKA